MRRLAKAVGGGEPRNWRRPLPEKLETRKQKLENGIELGWSLARAAA
jgi:hypothetical protein